MEINTKHFGPFEVDDEATIFFPEGLPGFEHLKKFVIINRLDLELPVCWLQSIENEELAFVLIDPFYVDKDYDIDIDDKEIEVIEAKGSDEILIYSIVVVPKDLRKMTANLRAPVLVNMKKKLGKQVVLNDTKYNLKYRVFGENR
jgi:flagellar assembly factor FliW